MRSSVRNDWQRILAFEEMPHLENPAKGYIVTANNLATPYFPYYGYGGSGATDRSETLTVAIKTKIAIIWTF